MSMNSTGSAHLAALMPVICNTADFADRWTDDRVGA